MTQVAIGHANPLTTAAYLRADQGEADRIIRELGALLSLVAPSPALAVV